MKTYRNTIVSFGFITAVLMFLMPVSSRAAFTTGNLAVFSADSASTNNATFTILELSPAANQSIPVNSIPINGTSGGSALRTSGSAASTGYLVRQRRRLAARFCRAQQHQQLRQCQHPHRARRRHTE